MRIKSIPLMTVSEDIIIQISDHKELESDQKNQDDQIQLFEVEEILQKKLNKSDPLYLVKWKGYTEQTWEPISSLQNCLSLIDQYEEKIQQLAIMNVKKKAIKKAKVEQRINGSFLNGDQVNRFSQYGRIIFQDGELQKQLKVHWKNRKYGKPKSTWYSVKELHKRAPIKLIHFYESQESIQNLFKNQEYDSNESTQ